MLDEPIAATGQSAPREEDRRCGIGDMGDHTREGDASTLPCALLGEGQERRADATPPKRGRNHQLVQQGARWCGKLSCIGHMYETDHGAVNRGEVEIAPQVRHHLAKAPQCSTLRRGHRHPAAGQQGHDGSEVRTPGAADVEATLWHVSVLSKLA